MWGAPLLEALSPGQHISGCGGQSRGLTPGAVAGVCPAIAAGTSLGGDSAYPPVLLCSWDLAGRLLAFLSRLPSSRLL